MAAASDSKEHKLNWMMITGRSHRGDRDDRRRDARGNAGRGDRVWHFDHHGVHRIPVGGLLQFHVSRAAPVGADGRRW